jgi:formylmethanofuran dehydrogenase subunit C
MDRSTRGWPEQAIVRQSPKNAPRAANGTITRDMPLCLEYNAATTLPLELTGILPASLRGKSRGDIERQRILHGNRQLPLGEFFRVSGKSDDDQLWLDGDLSGVDWIGAGLDAGTIVVNGPVGQHLGAQMAGGAIQVRGDAGDYAGSEMRGGLLHVRGNAGDLAGGNYPGSRRGMRGGTLLVDGDAGAELGRAMRRGLIAVGGSTGQAPGYDMIAGTIAIFGHCGPRAGAGMRRGTILVFSGESPDLLPTFRHACRGRFGFVPLVLAELRRLGFPPADCGGDGVFNMYCGDLLALGKGEILVRARQAGAHARSVGEAG